MNFDKIRPAYFIYAAFSDRAINSVIFSSPFKTQHSRWILKKYTRWWIAQTRQRTDEKGRRREEGRKWREKKVRNRWWRVMQATKHKHKSRGICHVHHCRYLLLESAMSTAAPWSSRTLMMSTLPLNAAWCRADILQHQSPPPYTHHCILAIHLSIQQHSPCHHHTPDSLHQSRHNQSLSLSQKHLISTTAWITLFSRRS